MGERAGGSGEWGGWFEKRFLTPFSPGKTLYDKYIYSPRSSGTRDLQWSAITNHAKNHGLRLAAFFTFYEGKAGLTEQVIKKGLQKGVVVLIISLKE